MSLDLTVIVPVLDEEDNVEPLAREITDSLASMGCAAYQILFIDDGSTDRTAERLRALSAIDDRIVTVRMRRNYGQAAALQAGFDLAAGRIVVTMDGDLQNDPKDIGRMVELIDEGYDVVSGWRKDRKDKFVTRRIPSIAANWLIGKVTGVRIHDNGCTLKAYRRAVIKRIRLYSEMHRFLAPLLSLSGSRYKEVVVNHRERRFGNSKYGLSRVWKVFLDLLTIKMILRFSSHPAAWFVLLSLPILLTCVVGATGTVYLYLTAPPGEFPIVLPSVTILLAFASVHLFLLGMFAELAVRLGDFRESDPIVTTREASA